MLLTRKRYPAGMPEATESRPGARKDGRRGDRTARRCGGRVTSPAAAASVPPAGPDGQSEQRDEDEQDERLTQGCLAAHLGDHGDDERHRGEEPEDPDEHLDPLGASPRVHRHGGQPLTPPAVRPATMRRCRIRTRMTSGMVTIVPAAMIAVYG